MLFKEVITEKYLHQLRYGMFNMKALTLTNAIYFTVKKKKKKSNDKQNPHSKAPVTSTFQLA